jgi:hypothetical protein
MLRSSSTQRMSESIREMRMSTSSREKRISQAELVQRIVEEGVPEEEMDAINLDHVQRKARQSASRSARSSSAGVDVVDDSTRKDEPLIYGNALKGAPIQIMKRQSNSSRSGLKGLATGEPINDPNSLSPDTTVRDGLLGINKDGTIDNDQDSDSSDGSSNSSSASSASGSGLSSGAMTPSGMGGQSGMTSGAMTPNYGSRFEGLESMAGSRRSSFSAVKGLIGSRRNRVDELSEPSCFCIPGNHRLREDLYDIISHWSFDNFMFFLIFASCVTMARFVYGVHRAAYEPDLYCQLVGIGIRA